jgi:hypothetical protein
MGRRTSRLFKRAIGHDKTEVIEAFRFDWIGNVA